MDRNTTAPIGDDSALYLDHLNELIAEMNVGMGAITANSAESLKLSVARQEALCATLAHTMLAGGDRLRQLSQSPVPLSDEAVELAIWQASKTIRQLNLQYDALLRHSGKAIAMLSALCNNHTGRATEPQGSWAKQQTWSCSI